jgi:DDE superfamily endonuclease
MPTRRAVWRPNGQPVMLPTPGPPTKHSGLGAVNSHTGATVVLCRRHQRRKKSAAWLQARLEHHPAETGSVAWDQATTPEDADVEAVVRGAAGRLVLRDLPTDSPWLHPIARRWRQFRREVTHGELCARVQALLAAAHDVLARDRRAPHRLLSIIGAIPKN